MVISALEKPSHQLDAEGESDQLVIGFVNNMPDAAIRSSERQFRAMLQAAANGVEVVLRGFFCRKISAHGHCSDDFSGSLLRCRQALEQSHRWFDRHRRRASGR